MADFIMLMHNDVTRPTRPEEWDRYIGSVHSGQHFVGGSAVGAGVTLKGDTESAGVTSHIGGYMVLNARDLEEAKSLTRDNPVRLAGGTVEIRDLPKT